MFAYSSISPYYLDYIASARTRQEILDDPQLCHLLENPYLKDNMEMALHWKAAKQGGHDEKKEFLEYFFANGPELDTDTILYYRKKCYQEPEYYEIATTEITIEYIDQIRVSKYGKDNDKGNCFTKPCNYLGPMSISLGMMGDSQNFLTLSNIFAKSIKTNKDSKNGETEMESPWGLIRRHLTQKILPNIRVGCQMLYNNMRDQAQDFLNSCEKAGITDHINLGDPYAIDRSEMLSSATKLNLYSRLGDCARLWQHMRQFNPYNKEQNGKGPIENHMKVDNKDTNGTAMDNTPEISPIKRTTPSTVKAMAAKGDKYAEAVNALNHLDWVYTQNDIEILDAATKPKATQEDIKAALDLIERNNLEGYRGKKRTDYDEKVNEIISNSGEDWDRYNDVLFDLYKTNDEREGKYTELANRLLSAVREQRMEQGAQWLSDYKRTQQLNEQDRIEDRRRAEADRVLANMEYDAEEYVDEDQERMRARDTVIQSERIKAEQSAVYEELRKNPPVF